MSDPDLPVEIDVQPVTEWLAADHLSWATATRFHARKLDAEGLVVLTAKSDDEPVGCVVFDRQMSHLHYIETREDCRRRCVARRLWARVRKEAVHRDITACADSEEGKRRLLAWGFREAEGMWTWKHARGASSRVRRRP